ncbi:MAG: serine hydrolase domain-containing protein, partial [Thermoguttaceae bacterium]
MNDTLLSALIVATSLAAGPNAHAASMPLPRSTPEAQGISSQAICDFVTAADKINTLHSFMVVRHGHVIAEAWWKPEAADKPHVLHSLSKSFNATAVGLAIEAGKLGLDDPVLKFFPADAPADVSDNLKAMKVRDLLTMSCGHDSEPKAVNGAPSVKQFLAHPVPHKPGTHFQYNTMGSYTLSAIVTKVTGQTSLEFLKPRLFEPLGIENPEWGTSPEGNSLGGYGLYLRTEDIAKFGQLYLQKGKWNGKQLIPAQWIEQATSKQVPNDQESHGNIGIDWRQGYGFQFWRCTHDAFRGDGAAGQLCVVIPDKDAVIAITADTGNFQGEMNAIWDKLHPAFQAQALPEDPAGQEKVKQAVAKLEAHPAKTGTGAASVRSPSLWQKARNEKQVLTLSGWFTAQNVRDLLSNPGGLDAAVNWCKENGVTKVYLEAFGRGLYADRKTLVDAKNRFLKEGLEVQSGVTTTKFGKESSGNGWHSECYTNQGSQEELQRIFEYAASMFDEIIIDDWYFTECHCDECVAARGNQTWPKYYGDLMVKMSRERVLKPAKAVNPKAKVIIKYPQWYDQFHKRGYEVVRESRDFGDIWVGTESRNFDYATGPGYEIGYNAYFNMRWLGSLGRVGGGWFDSGRTTAQTFVEQARHTVLGDGKEIILWCYGNMLAETNGTGAIKGTPVANMKALSKELSGLIELAKIVRGKPIKGIHLLKPANSEPFEEEWVCSFLGNLGLPLVPAHELDEQALSAVFPVQAMEDSGFPATLQRMLDKGTPIVITDGLAKRLTDQALLKHDNLTVLKVQGSPKKLLKLTREELRPIRDKLLAPMGMTFDAPNQVELYLFGDNLLVVENINDEAVDVTLDLPHISNVRKALILPKDTGNAALSQSGNSVKIRIS